MFNGERSSALTIGPIDTKKRTKGKVSPPTLANCSSSGLCVIPCYTDLYVNLLCRVGLLKVEPVKCHVRVRSDARWLEDDWRGEWEMTGRGSRACLLDHNSSNPIQASHSNFRRKTQQKGSNLNCSNYLKVTKMALAWLWCTGAGLPSQTHGSNGQ